MLDKISLKLAAAKITTQQANLHISYTMHQSQLFFNPQQQRRCLSIHTLFTLAASVLICFAYPSISCAQQHVADTYFNLEQLLTQYMPAEFKQRNITIDLAKRLMRQKCKKTAVDIDAYEQIEAAAEQLLHCAQNIGNFNIVLTELDAASPIAELDVVIHKYCNKRSKAENCLRTFNAKLLPCLTVREQQQNDILLRLVRSLFEFICYKNGNRIALFIAEQGPECLEANKHNIANCMNASFAAYMTPQQIPLLTLNPDDIDAVPELLLGPRQCIDLHVFEECVLSFLEKCNEITPANIIELLFKFVKKETKCRSGTEQRFDKETVEQQRSTAGSLKVLSGSMALVLTGAWFQFLFN